MESRKAGCVSARCVPDCYGEQDSRLSEQRVCLVVMESRKAGCVIARCVPDGYGEQDGRLCHSKVRA